MLWSGAGLPAVASATALGLAAAAPSLWDEAERGTLIGRTLDAWRLSMPRADRNPDRYVAGWTRTYTRGVDLDREQVAVVRTDDRGVIVGCALYLVNSDTPARPDVNVKAVWGRVPDPAGVAK